MVELKTKIKTAGGLYEPMPKPKTRYQLYYTFNDDYANSDSVEELCAFVLEKHKGEFTHTNGTRIKR